MNFPRQKQAFVFLFIVFAVFGLFTSLTNSLEAILKANAFFLAVTCFFFIVSVLLWVFSWALLMQRQSKLPFKKVFLVGCSSVYAALTPLQVGTDALRALMIKDYFNAPMSDSISASMLAKGLKFFIIALLASASMLLFFVSSTNVFFRVALLSGFIVILLAVALFLLPLNKKIGVKTAGFFRALAWVSKKFLKIEKFFLNYSSYLGGAEKKTLLFVFAIVAFSLFFEFFSLFFSFEAASAKIPLASIAVFFVLASVLERTPFLPRGIGIVESAGFFFLSANVPSITPEKIAASMVIFGIARIIVPTMLSLVLYSVVSKKLRVKK